MYASRYASDEIDSDEQREVYGILVGSVDVDKCIVYIKQAIGIVKGQRTGVEFENKQYVDLSNIDESVWKKSVEYETGDVSFAAGGTHTLDLAFSFLRPTFSTKSDFKLQIPSPSD